MSDATTSQDTLQIVAAVLGSELSCDPMTIGRETTADDVDGWDSLAHARLIMKIEEQFNVRFPGERLFDLDCVGDLVTLVDDCRATEGTGNAQTGI